MIAWLTHHLPKHPSEVGGIPGKYRGGAEMTDAKYLKAGPSNVSVFGPNQWEQALEYPQIIITGTDLLSDRAMMWLAKKKPIVMVHHKQTRSPARQHLLSSASLLICHTPAHLAIEKSWTQPAKSTWLLSSHNPADFEVQKKENFALWAGRLHPQKGPDNALDWAEKNQIELIMYHDKPRVKVLETMSRAKHFVFLPNDFDAEPRTVIEAVLSGCQVHINDQVGIGSVPNWDDPEKLAGLVSTSAETFWELVN